jgi:hypothetical protein
MTLRDQPHGKRQNGKPQTANGKRQTANDTGTLSLQLPATRFPLPAAPARTPALRQMGHDGALDLLDHADDLRRGRLAAAGCGPAAIADGLGVVARTAEHEVSARHYSSGAAAIAFRGGDVVWCFVDLGHSASAAHLL